MWSSMQSLNWGTVFCCRYEFHLPPGSRLPPSSVKIKFNNTSVKVHLARFIVTQILYALVLLRRKFMVNLTTTGIGICPKHFDLFIRKLHNQANVRIISRYCQITLFNITVSFSVLQREFSQWNGSVENFYNHFYCVAIRFKFMAPTGITKFV